MSMNIQRMGSNIEPIQSLDEKLAAKHKNYVLALNQKFQESELSAKVKDDPTRDHLFISVQLLSKLEDYIAAKTQLLNITDESHEFFEIQNDQIQLAKAHYMKLYNKFNQL